MQVNSCFAATLHQEVIDVLSVPYDPVTLPDGRSIRNEFDCPLLESAEKYCPFPHTALRGQYLSYINVPQPESLKRQSPHRE